MLLRILTFPARKPLAFGVGFSCIKTSFADLLVQRYVEKRETIDWRRNSAFGLFGLFYLGGVQYFLYVNVFGRLFPKAEAFATKPISQKLRDTAGQITMIKQVVLDQAVHHPILYFPCFYLMKEVVMGGKPEDAYKKYRVNMVEDIIALWKIWVPATAINFTFMPMWGRIPFVATTSLFWTCLLSYMRGNDPAVLPKEKIPDTWGNQGRVLQMALNASRSKLDPSLSYVVITSSGDSKFALTKLSKALYESGGNVVRSTAMTISGQTIVTMVVELVPTNVAKMAKQLSEFKWCNVTINQLITPEGDDDRFECYMTCIGGDRPGILTEVAHFLEERDIRIENFVQDNTLKSSPDGKQQMEFCLHLILSSSQNLNLEELQKSLDSFGTERELELKIRPNDTGEMIRFQ